MPDLSNSHIDIVIKKINEQRANSFAFSNELLDHVCCKIEQLMADEFTFEEALKETSPLYHKREIKNISRNFNLIFNFSGYLNSFIIYASLLFYLGSWIFHWGQSDWIGLIAFILISVLLLRYNILFYNDKNIKHKTSLSIFSGLGFILLFFGSLYRFMWLNFGASGQHVMPVLLFAWLVISIASVIYHKALFAKNTNRLFLMIGNIQIILSTLSLSTFVFPVTFKYIPFFALIIIVINSISFIALLLKKGFGKGFLKLLLLSSSFIVFSYTPHKAIVNNEVYNVQFEVMLHEEVAQPNLFLYLNYFKYGKEVLVLNKETDTNFKSEVIKFTGGNLRIAYTVLKDSLDIQKVIQNSEIIKYDIKLEQADTVFTLKYNQNIVP